MPEAFPPSEEPWAELAKPLRGARNFLCKTGSQEAEYSIKSIAKIDGGQDCEVVLVSKDGQGVQVMKLSKLIKEIKESKSWEIIP